MVQLSRRSLGHFGRVIPFSGRALRSVSDQIRVDAKQPGRERRTGPFKSRQVSKRFMKDFAGEICRAGGIPHASRHIRIHDREIVFIQLDKPRRIALRGLDKVAFGGNLSSIEATILCRFATGHWVPNYINCRPAERLRRESQDRGLLAKVQRKLESAAEGLVAVRPAEGSKQKAVGSRQLPATVAACFLLSAFCFLPSACCLLPAPYILYIKRDPVREKEIAG